VVEVEHPQVALAAVDARITLEVGRYERASAGDPAAARGAALAPVQFAARPEVLLEAGTTPVLTPVAEPVERVRRQDQSATAASSRHFGHERMFVYASDRKCRRL